MTPTKSVMDSDTAETLRSNLVSCTIENAPDPSFEWQLHPCVLEAEASQSIDQEMARLQTLKSYLILDCQREEQFERITAMASRVFDVPIALISLVDLARQWFMSNRGLGDTRETPRNQAFCSHAILAESDIFIVPDATKDSRFMKNPLVLGEPLIRFYAGAPLMSPEGHKLGTLCIIDQKPRPGGLNLNEKQNLREMSAMAMDILVNRKDSLSRSSLSMSGDIACTAHDLLTPLSGIQLNLSLLQDDADLMLKMDDNQKEMLQNSSICCDAMSRICHDRINSFQENAAKKRKDRNAPFIDPGKDGCLIISDLVRNLSKLIRPYPKKVPLSITIDERLPPVVKTDDLKVFRSALNYLTNACKHTENGSIKMRIYPKQITNDRNDVIFEVEDTGSGVDLGLYAKLFSPFTDIEGDRESFDELPKLVHSGIGLFSVATNISSIGGDYGFNPRPHQPQSSLDNDSESALSHSVNETSSYASSQMLESGSIFWFSIPLIIPENTKEILRAHSQMPRSWSCGSLSLDNLSLKDPRHNYLINITPKPSENPPSQISNEGNFCKRRRTEWQEEEQEEERINVLRSHMDTVEFEKDAKCGVRPHNTAYQCIAMTESSLLDDRVSSIANQTASQRIKCALVIDDSITIRKSISRALSKMGFTVTQACNGMEGLKQLQIVLFDLVLCDFLMPIMDGLDCVQQYRSWEKSNRPWFRQVIVGISAHASRQDAGRGQDIGMDKFIAKPVPLQTLKNLTTWIEVLNTGCFLD